MQFNIIFMCLMVWGTIEFVAIIASVTHRIQLRQEYEAKLLYMKRLLDLSQKGLSTSQLLKELYFSFTSNKTIRVVLLKALNKPAIKGLDYITAKFGCEPMKLIHDYIKRKGCEGGPVYIRQEVALVLWDKIEAWKLLQEMKFKKLKARRRWVSFEKAFFMLLNLYLYSKLQTEISLCIFVIVNTTGVILFIILDYECCIQNEVLNDGILARGIGKKKSQPPAAGLQSVFQLLGGLGLIINTITIVDSWVGPIV